MSSKSSQHAKAIAREKKNAAKKAKSGSSGKSSVPSFNFDSKAAQKAYEKLASGIYDPQIAALKATQEYNTKAAETAKVTTKQQFTDLLNNTIESINKQGAFFGGGSLDKQAKINTDQANALSNIDLQTTIANQGVSSQIGTLLGQKAEYVSSGVASGQSSAYNQFQDSLNNYFKQQQFDLQAQNDALAQANADRNYALSARASGRADYNLANPSLQSVSKTTKDAFGGSTQVYGTYNPRTGEYIWQQ